MRKGFPNIESAKVTTKEVVDALAIETYTEK
jgi:hypothetical protein